MHENHYRQLLQQTPLAVIEWNSNFEVKEWNPAAEQIFGFSRDQAMGCHAFDIIVPEESKQEVTEIWQTLLANKQGGTRSTSKNITKDGQNITCEWYNTPLVAENGEFIGVASLIDDITARLRNEKAIQHLAYHDALTGLVNRSQFEQRLQELLDNPQRQKNNHALLYLDLDQFKIINDTCGHAAGDALLKAITQLLRTTVRESDMLARLGGDEFGILLNNCPLTQAKRIAANIINAVRDFRFDWQGATFEIGVSIGLMPITVQDTSLAQVLRNADMACYMAKDKGRGCIHVYAKNDVKLSRKQQELDWVSRISEALDNDRFVIYQQDIHSLNNPQKRHKELLLRLYDDKNHLITPNKFIHLAERYNQMPLLDRWMIQHAFEFIAATAENMGNVLYSINLSAASLHDMELLEYISRQFSASGINPAQICFEITETTAFSSLAETMALFDKLKSLGCSLALDDFGEGIGSFTYMKKLPIDYLKIDGSFVNGLSRDPTDCAIIESINNIGHILNIETIAECVENKTTLNKLKQIGIDYAQGFVYGKPEPLIMTNQSASRREFA